jgi:hypothetical protein
MFVVSKKNTGKMLLTLLMTFGVITLLFAAPTVVSADSLIFHAYETDCEKAQLERLMELYRGDITTAFNSDGEPVSVPKIEHVIPYSGILIIVLADTPTSECIDFILSYTGISEERALIRGFLDPGNMILPRYERHAPYSQETAPHRTWTAEQKITVISALTLRMLVFTVFVL